jgi:GDP-D-mannose dehydratase
MTFGWEPKIKFSDLVKMMVEADLKLFKDKSSRGVL